MNNTKTPCIICGQIEPDPVKHADARRKLPIKKSIARILGAVIVGLVLSTIVAITTGCSTATTTEIVRQPTGLFDANGKPVSVNGATPMVECSTTVQKTKVGGVLAKRPVTKDGGCHVIQ